VLRRRLLQALLVVAVLLALAGPVVLFAAWSASPGYRVWSELPIAGVATPWKEEAIVARRPAGPDPWGRPWAPHRIEVRDYHLVPVGAPAETRSVGPDGVDGDGDDVTVDGDMELVRLAPHLGVLAAVLLLWLLAAARSLGGGRGPEPWHDAVRAVVAASVPAAGVALAVATWGVPGPLGSLRLLVPTPVALVGAAWLVLTLAVLYWRVRPGVPRRKRGSEERLIAAVVALGVAGLALFDGFRTHADELRPRQRFAMARFGARDAVEGILQADLPTLRAYLALEPDVEWGELSDLALIDLARLGPEAAPLLARAQRGDWMERRSWGALRKVDPRLGSLAEAFAAEPGRYTGLLLHRPRLLAALAGVDAARRALSEADRTAQRSPEESPVFEHGLWGESAAELRQGAQEAAREIAGEGDAWLVVEVEGDAPVSSWLDDQPPALFSDERRAREGFLVVGPLPPSPAGRTLSIFDPLVSASLVKVELPALHAHHTLWIEVHLDTGASQVRACSRPTVRRR
jgi:hypothetical protein